MNTGTPARRLIVYTGPQQWGISAVDALIQSSEVDDEHVYWINGKGVEGKGAYFDLLGQDKSIVVINAFSGFNPDVIGIAAGTIMAGGALVIICPSFAAWPEYLDPEKSRLAAYPLAVNAVSGHYLARWASYLSAHEGIELIHPELARTVAPVVANSVMVNSATERSEDQQTAVGALVNRVSNTHCEPVIVIANRGRGKSAALGMAAAELLVGHKAKNIVVTSSGFLNAKQVFNHATLALNQSGLGQAQFSEQEKSIEHANGQIQYIAPDALIASPVECDVLFVDEAAAIGIHRLEALLGLYPCIAFVSTEHGYEGSGRGFSLKFKALLAKYYPRSTVISMHSPIRWGDDDPLERWIDELLLLSTKNSSSSHAKAPKFDALVFGQIEQTELARDEALLQSVFQLLASAHYQTRPADLRLLLDAPNAQIWLAEFKGEIAGLVWSMAEGGLDLPMAKEIAVGRRRPQGHLAPQILTAHLGILEAATFNCLRIQRIVVRPEWQGQGIGRWMLQQLERQIESRVDYLASSFGTDEQLSRFWHKADFTTVRMSDKTNAASGLRSALVVKPISNAARTMVIKAEQIFAKQSEAQLASPLPDDIAELKDYHDLNTRQKPKLSSDEFNAAVLFSYGHRPYESTLSSLKRLALFSVTKLDTDNYLDDSPRRRLLSMRCLQNRTWAECSKELGYSGRAACVAALRAVSQKVLSEVCSAESIQSVRDDYKV